jgi:hypothetical protein
VVIVSIGQADITRLAAIGTVIQPVHTQPDVFLRLAKAAVFLARALALRLIALGAEGDHPGGVYPFSFEAFSVGALR